MNYSRFNNNPVFPRESVYFHFRYTIKSDEQDEEQIKKIINCELLEWYAISVIENEGSTIKNEHRHVTIKFKNKKTVASAKKSIVTNFKYGKNDIYFKPKYQTSTKEELLKYTLKSGTFKTNAPEELLKECELNNIENFNVKTELEKEKKRNNKELYKTRFQHIRIGDLEYFYENDPKYLLTAEFNRALVWAQDDNFKKLLMLQNFYIIDKSETGKSSAVYFITDPDALYKKSKSRDTFDGWNNHKHKDMLIDELDSHDALNCIGGIEGIKEFADYYSFTAKFMFANRNLHIRPKRIFITSNTDLSVLLSKDKHGKPIMNVEIQKEAIKRRFKCVKALEFHRIFGLRLDKTIKRIVFDFKGMQEERYKPDFEYFDDYLTNKFQSHLKFWLENGEDQYIAQQAEEQQVNERKRKLKERKQKNETALLEKLYQTLDDVEEKKINELNLDGLDFIEFSED